MKKVLYIFGQLEDQDVDWLIRAGARQVLGPGEVLIPEAARPEAVYIVLQGHLSVSTRAAGEIARLGRGELVGEISLIDRRPALASATAIDEAVVLRVPRAVLEPQLARDAGFAARFYRATSIVLSERLRATTRRLDRSETPPDDEIDLELLDTVHLAGARFDRLLRAVLGA